MAPLELLCFVRVFLKPSADPGDDAEAEQNDEHVALEQIREIVQEGEAFCNNAAGNGQADGVQAYRVVGHNAGEGSADTVDDVGTAGSFNIMLLQNAARNRADKENGDGSCTNGETGDDFDDDGEPFCLLRGGSRFCDFIKQHTEHAAAAKHFKQCEHEEREADYVQHAGQACADRAAGREHGWFVNEAEDQDEQETDNVADQKRSDEAPAFQHQDDHDDRDDQHDESESAGGVCDRGQDARIGGTEADDNKENCGDRSCDQGVGETGADNVANFRFLSDGRSDGRVGDRSEIVAEDCTADDRTGDDRGVSTDCSAYREDNRHNGYDCTVGSTAGNGNQAACEEGNQREEAGFQTHAGHSPNQSVDQAALTEFLRQYAGKQESENNRAEGFILDSFDSGFFKFFLVFCKQESDAEACKTGHAEQDKRDFFHGCDEDHQRHEREQWQARAKGAAIKLEFLLFFHGTLLLFSGREGL